MKISIAQALKFKNKKIKELNTLFSRAQQNNSIVEGRNRAYSSIKMLEQAQIKMDELINIKAAISTANQKIQNKIYRLSELKSFVSNLQRMSTQNGPQEQRYNDTITIYTTEIDTVTNDEMIDKFEKEIEKIQEDLDKFNHATQIEVID